MGRRALQDVLREDMLIYMLKALALLHHRETLQNKLPPARPHPDDVNAGRQVGHNDLVQTGGVGAFCRNSNQPPGQVVNAQLDPRRDRTGGMTI
jgi:hypothetical protein